MKEKDKENSRWKMFSKDSDSGEQPTVCGKKEKRHNIRK